MMRTRYIPPLIIDIEELPWEAHPHSMSTTFPSFDIDGKNIFTKSSTTPPSTRSCAVVTKVTSTRGRNRSNASSTEFHQRA